MKFQITKSITFILAIFLAACTPTHLPPATASLTSTERVTIPTASPTAVPAPATEQPHLNLPEEAVLYSGPGDVDFDPITTLPAGSEIFPLGIYVDFVEARTVVNGSEFTGYLLKNALGALPSTIPILQSDQVPWKPLYSPTCMPGEYDPVTRTNSLTSSDDIATNQIRLDAPLHIRLDGLSYTNGSSGSIKIFGWRQQTRLDIWSENGKYVLGFRDSYSLPIKLEIPDLGISDQMTIQIIFDQVDGKSFSVQDRNGIELRHLDVASLGLNMPDGLFPGGIFQIGMSVPPGSTMLMVGLSAGILPDGKASDQPDLEPGLAQLAKKDNLMMGVGLTVGDMLEKKYCGIVQRDFNVVALGNFSNRDWWLGPGKYDWSTLDQEVGYFHSRGYIIEASHLIWGPAVPDWLRNSNLSRADYMNILEQYIQDVVGRYKDRVQEWSIANEVLSRYVEGDTEDFWRQKIGLDYIAMAFRWAREADPSGVLILNDTRNDSIRDSVSAEVVEEMLATVRDLKAQGVPIDVVGMQMHMLVPWESQTPPKVAAMVKTMQSFAALGVRIYITEFDVDLHNRPGTQTERWQFQANIYADALTACIESGVCDQFITWGITDPESWLECNELWCSDTYPDAEPLMFDAYLNPKPAYFAVRDILLNSSIVASPDVNVPTR